MRRRRLLTTLMTVAAIAAASCGTTGAPGAGATIMVYSASGLGDWFRPQFEKFTRETGVAVRLFEAGSGELVSRVNSRAVWERLDGADPPAPADLLVVLPPFIQRAAHAGILQPSGVATDGIAPDLVDPSGLFVPIASTALCLITNPHTDPRPVTWDDLLRPDLKGKIQYSAPGETGDGTVLLLLLQHIMGKQAALSYLARLQANTTGPATSTGELQAKVDSGELLVANGDVQMNLAAIKRGSSKAEIFFPAMPDHTRTTVSLSYVAGVTATAHHPEDAKRLLAQLLSDEAQRAVHADAAGIPVRESIARQTAGEDDHTNPASLLHGLNLWVPDWSAVLTELDGDLGAYAKAIR